MKKQNYWNESDSSDKHIINAKSETSLFNNELLPINRDILNKINKDFIDQNDSLNYSEILNDNNDNYNDDKAFDIDFLEFFDSKMNENVLLSEDLVNSSFSKISENFGSDDDEICNLSPELINGLYFLNIRKEHNLTKKAFNDIMDTFIGNKISSLAKELNCPFCNESSYVIEKNKINYKKPNLLYQLHHITSSIYNADRKIGDLFDGKLYKELVEEGSMDGYQIFRQQTDNCWIIIFFNGNLNPIQQPKDLNSFLYHIVHEIKELEGDILALTKLMCLTGHNSYMGCRFCYLKKVYCNEAKHIYYPSQSLYRAQNHKYDPNNLPLRTVQSFKEDIQLVQNANNKKIAIQNTDKHWTGNFFKNPLLNINDYALNSQTWRTIGNKMHLIRKEIPLGFGRPPCNIFKHSAGFKTSECIANCGPCWSFWQFPIERLCGMLLPLIYSKIHPYSNLANSVINRTI
ncbi:20412_t:CDS:10 [Gigaspora margarita]|uniref:20412_t:CDS:1 n=1 Tax=Gigaspora margarita TaxID=4874 RepID=A0ABN7UGD1_GIGMA|nr:20412_t:CDS:10 [Gigaspora margarita]